ncbi:MAG: hypothetical protein LBH43_00140 [Treponema sp.]|nr:hypothetical protein [Treponema sp.]
MNSVPGVRYVPKSGAMLSAGISVSPPSRQAARLVLTRPSKGSAAGTKKVFDTGMPPQASSYPHDENNSISMDGWAIFPHCPQL